MKSSTLENKQVAVTREL